MAITAQTLIEFLKDSLNVEEEIGEETELFSTGILDSVAMLNVISFVEEKARVEISPGDVTLDNFDTVSRILGYVESQR